MRTFLGLLILLVLSTFTYSQEKMEVEGAITIENSNSETPPEGTIRYNTSTKDFEGWNGTAWVSLTRATDGTTGMVYDIDENAYKTVQIGNQVWMAENLRSSKYTNGNSIGEITIKSSWAQLNIDEKGAWCWYNNASGYNSIFGKLYNWYTVNDPRGLCPVGWHVPSDADWQELMTYLGGIGLAGGKLKAVNQLYWNAPNTGAINEKGFTGLPGGYRNHLGDFGGLTYIGYHWSSSNPKGWDLGYDRVNVIALTVDARDGFSVRCIKN